MSVIWDSPCLRILQQERAGNDSSKINSKRKIAGLAAAVEKDECEGVSEVTGRSAVRAEADQEQHHRSRRRLMWLACNFYQKL